MKIKSASHLVLTGLFVVLVLAASNSIVRAQGSPPTTSWIRSPINGPGDWFDCDNWNPTCPNGQVNAYINNGGQAQILGGDATAENLFLGDNQGDSGSVTVDGASAILDGTDIYIGNRGVGNLTIRNGGIVRNRYAYIAAILNPSQPNSKGYVNVASQGQQLGYAWYPAGIFIGCTPASNGVGGNATVNFSDLSKIKIVNYDNNPGVIVGLSGTLTGHGIISIFESTTVSKTVKVFGTLAPSGSFRIDGKLDLQLQANTVLHVDPSVGSDTVYVTDSTGEGHAHLDGRVTVMMTGSFAPGMSFNLLDTRGGRDTTTFASESIIYKSNPGDPCFTPVITYYDHADGSSDVNLEIHDCE